MMHGDLVSRHPLQTPRSLLPGDRLVVWRILRWHALVALFSSRLGVADLAQCHLEHCSTFVFFNNYLNLD
jgi:hypothetical protein